MTTFQIVSALNALAIIAAVMPVQTVQAALSKEAGTLSDKLEFSKPGRTARVEPETRNASVSPAPQRHLPSSVAQTSSGSRCSSSSTRVEAAFRSFFDAVLHRRIAVFGLSRSASSASASSGRPDPRTRASAGGSGTSARAARARRPRGTRPRRRQRRCGSSVRAAGTDVHLLDDSAIAPPFRDQLRVGPRRRRRVHAVRRRSARRGSRARSGW